MIIYVTRHGQPDLDMAAWNSNPEIPLCDPVLTEKGRVQAKYLGQCLKQKKFNGLVISSPYRRTLETAQVVAEQTNSKIQVEAAIQEVVNIEGFPDFVGLNTQMIRELYPNVSIDDNLSYPWLSSGPEDSEDLKRRIKPFIDKLFREVTNYAEVLLVGHGASVHTCKKLLLRNTFNKDCPEKYNWNCSLSTYVFGQSKKLEDFDLFNIDHIPKNIITSNKLQYSKELQYAN